MHLRLKIGVNEIVYDCIIIAVRLKKVIFKFYIIETLWIQQRHF